MLRRGGRRCFLPRRLAVVTQAVGGCIVSTLFLMFRCIGAQGVGEVVVFLMSE